MEKGIHKGQPEPAWLERSDFEGEWDYDQDVDEDYLVSLSNEPIKLKSMTNKRELSWLINSWYLNERKLSHDTNPILPSIISSKLILEIWNCIYINSIWYLFASKHLQLNWKSKIKHLYLSKDVEKLILKSKHILNK